MPIPTPTPAERFATMLQWLAGAVAAMSGGDRLSYLLIGLIVDRIRGIKPVSCSTRHQPRPQSGHDCRISFWSFNRKGS